MLAKKEWAGGAHGCRLCCCCCLERSHCPVNYYNILQLSSFFWSSYCFIHSSLFSFSLFVSFSGKLLFLLPHPHLSSLLFSFLLHMRQFVKVISTFKNGLYMQNRIINFIMKYLTLKEIKFNKLLLFWPSLLLLWGREKCWRYEHTFIYATFQLNIKIEANVHNQRRILS